MREKNRISRIFYFEGLSFGLFISSIIFCLIELLRILKGELKFIESPWTVIIPLVVSTYVSVRAITEQSRLQVDSADEMKDREKLIAQAELPLALSNLIQNCRTMLQYHFKTSARQVDWQDFDRLFDGLKPAIRYSNRETSNRLLKVIRTYQVLRARMLDFDEPARNRAQSDPRSDHHYKIWSSAADWATLHAMIEQAFAYARGTADDIPSVEVSSRVYLAFHLNDITI